MKKIYRKPSLSIENFVTEGIMDQDNALSAPVAVTLGTTWNFLTPGSGNTLNSIDYSTFAN